MLKILDVDNIVNGKNIRNEKDDQITELAASILKQGLINPILVRKRERMANMRLLRGTDAFLLSNI